MHLSFTYKGPLALSKLDSVITFREKLHILRNFNMRRLVLVIFAEVFEKCLIIDIKYEIFASKYEN